MAIHNGLNSATADKDTFGGYLRVLEENAPAPPDGGKRPGVSRPANTPIVRSYHARTVEAALEQAQAELGPDAILIQSRRTPIERRHLGPLELVFSYEPAADRTAQRKPSRDAVAPRQRDVLHAIPAGNTTGGDESRVSSELAELRLQMEEIRRALTKSPQRGPELVDSPAAEGSNALAVARDLLLDSGFDRPLLEEILAAVEPELRGLDNAGGTAAGEPPTAAALWSVLRSEVAYRLPAVPEPEPRAGKAKALALAGPPGAGKTTALIKLALARGAGATRPIHLISTDSYRIGGTEQLRTYASILNTGVDFVDTPQAIAQVLEANAHKELILIDTPGLSGSNLELLDELTGYLGRQSAIERHLVLNATMRARDLNRCVGAYAHFAADYLLFTHLDETDSFGALCSVSIASGKPALYLSAGQQIPEDLEVATRERIVNLVCGRGEEKE